MLELLGIGLIICVIILFVELKKIKEENLQRDQEIRKLKEQLLQTNPLISEDHENKVKIEPQIVIQNTQSPTINSGTGVPYNTPQQQVAFAPINVNQKSVTPVDTIPTIAKTEENQLQKTPTVTQIPQKQQKKINFENLLGKNILGIAAIILIFIGIIAFGVLVFSQITDAIKVGGMFIGSFALAGAGMYLHKKSSNTFTESLTGCGFGAIFISIWTTHLYFDMISSTVALIMILLWIIGISVVSKILKYKYLSYIAYIATIITTIVTLIGGQEQLVMISLYQVITLLLIIVANKENKILIKLSSFSSMFLNLILMGCHIAKMEDLAYEISKLYDASAITSQCWASILLLMMIALFNYIIYVFVTNKAESKNTVWFNVITNTLNSINIFLVIIGINRFASAYGLLEGISTITWDIIQETIAVATVFAIYLTHKFIIKNKFTTNIAIIFLEGVILLSTLCCENSGMNFLLILIPIINIFLTFANVKDEDSKKLFFIVGKVSLWVSGIILLFQMNEDEILLSTLSLVEILLAFTLNIYLNTLKDKKQLLGNYFETNLMLYGLVGIGIIIFGNVISSVSLGTILSTVILIILNVVKNNYIKEENDYVINRNLAISELFATTWVIISSFIMEIDRSWGDTGNAIAILLSIILIPMGLINIREIINLKKGFLSVMSCLKLTILSAISISMIFPDLFDINFAVSIYLMLMAGICIAIGFMKDVKPIRLYGLVTVMISVGKMVVFDVWDQESMIRVISFIAGGIICFAISAGYSYIEKKHLKENNSNKTSIDALLTVNQATENLIDNKEQEEYIDEKSSEKVIVSVDE